MWVDFNLNSVINLSAQWLVSHHYLFWWSPREKELKGPHVRGEVQSKMVSLCEKNQKNESKCSLSESTEAVHMPTYNLVMDMIIMVLLCLYPSHTPYIDSAM